MVKYFYEAITNPTEKKNWAYRIVKQNKNGFNVVGRSINLKDTKFKVNRLNKRK